MYKYKYLKYKQKYLQLGGNPTQIPGQMSNSESVQQGIANHTQGAIGVDPRDPRDPITPPRLDRTIKNSPTPLKPSRTQIYPSTVRDPQTLLDSPSPLRKRGQLHIDMSQLPQESIDTIFNKSGTIWGIITRDYSIKITNVIMNLKNVSLIRDIQLSSGSFGTVWRYKLETEPPQYVAIKFGNTHGALEKDIDVITQIGDTLCEMVKSKSLHVSPRYVPYPTRDIIGSPNNELIIMKYMDGGSLEKHTITSLNQIIQLFKYLLTTCKCLIAKGFYYTDMKVNNILCSLPFGSDFILGDLGGATQTNIVVTYPHYRRYKNESNTQLIKGYDLKSPANINDVFYGIGLVILVCMYSLQYNINITELLKKGNLCDFFDKILNANAKATPLTQDDLIKDINVHINKIKSTIKDDDLEKDTKNNVLNYISQCIFNDNIIPLFDDALAVL